MITIAGNARSTWLWALAGAGAVSVTGIVINIATDLKTSVLAWVAVAVATATGGFVTWAWQSATSGQRVRPMIVVANVAGVALAIILVVFALVTTPENRGITEATEQGRQTVDPPIATATERRSQTAPARVIQDVLSYNLVSSSDFCPTSDKVDLDTAHPGHGGQIQLGDYIDGCRVEGGLAELIIESHELHTPKNSQLLHLLDSSESAGHDECRATLREAGQLRSKISFDELHLGDHICVKTDQGNIAQVTITDMSRTVEASVTIEFTTWSSP